MIAVALALVAALAYGLSDFAGGASSRRASALGVVAVTYPISLLLALAVAPLVGGEPTVSSLGWGAVAGVAGGIAIWWFYLALASGPMSVVSPLTAVLVAGIPVVVGISLGERPGALSYVGILVAVVAVALVSWESDETVVGTEHPRFTAKVAWLTVGSGVAFALSFIALGRIEEGTGLWGLAVSRVTATLVVWCVIGAVWRGVVWPTKSMMPVLIGIGALDVLANGALIFAYQQGMLSLVSVVAALYPAATVLLAMIVLGERVGRLRLLGMVAAGVAVGLISVAA
ncbi:DMT family transporter [Rhodococcus sp. BL-253-APC-6A1W]|nr:MULTISPECIES: DMT family transporter [unclassified Rhodococcus (in: high G+C Gram-positive bacteria)]MBF0660576.1 DMT family transporter [Rhodococcus sp. (in: high G+C Gram-positive bacteria)]NMD94367.1 DMT family transporter [Rhodococcus sp. BL-253-APC-6A1W]